MAEWSMAVVLKSSVFKRPDNPVRGSRGLKSSQTDTEQDSAAIARYECYRPR
jgi:hypothetical protein